MERGAFCNSLHVPTSLDVVLMQRRELVHLNQRGLSFNNHKKPGLETKKIVFIFENVI